MEPRLSFRTSTGLFVTITALSRAQADALRETGGPAVALSGPADSTGLTAVLSGTVDGLRRAAVSASSHPFLASVGTKILAFLDNFVRSDYKVKCGPLTLDLSSRTQVMGVLNVTPDSFSDGGRFLDVPAAVARAKEMAAQGADIIDIGGESTRPGSRPVDEDEERARIVPVIERLSREVPVPLSIDTYKAGVAEAALRAGATIVNDISGLRFSPGMAAVVADHGAALIVMHIKGTPRDMQQNPVYEDLVGEIRDTLHEAVERAVAAGVDREQILIDPGIGFGKTVEHNLAILDRLDEFRGLGRPLVIGTSRKRFIGAVLDQPVPDERVEGTAATMALAVARGARIIRVHDVAQMVRVARMTDAVMRQSLRP